MESFPKHSTNEFETSIHSEILERLSLFLLFLPYTFEQETQLFLSEARFQIERIPPILKYMVHFVPGETEGVGDPDDADPDGFVIGKKQKQSQQKKARKVKKLKSNLKQQDLIRLNVTDPRTKQEAVFNAELLLDMLKVVLLVSTKLWLFKLPLSLFCLISMQHSNILTFYKIAMFAWRYRICPSFGPQSTQATMSKGASSKQGPQLQTRPLRIQFRRHTLASNP